MILPSLWEGLLNHLYSTTIYVGWSRKGKDAHLLFDMPIGTKNGYRNVQHFLVVFNKNKRPLLLALTTRLSNVDLRILSLPPSAKQSSIETLLSPTTVWPSSRHTCILNSLISSSWSRLGRIPVRLLLRHSIF